MKSPVYSLRREISWSIHLRFGEYNCPLFFNDVLLLYVYLRTVSFRDKVWVTYIVFLPNFIVGSQSERRLTSLIVGYLSCHVWIMLSVMSPPPPSPLLPNKSNGLPLSNLDSRDSTLRSSWWIMFSFKFSWTKITKIKLLKKEAQLSKSHLSFLFLIY